MSDARVARPEILDRLDLDRHAVIEASAGTGKTYALEHLIVELLLGRGLLLEQILVVTFTDKATREMRERVRAKLRAIHDAPSADAPTGEGLQSVSAWMIDELARRRLSDALAGFDRAPISTIHAFCQRVLTESAFDCARLLQQEPIESREAFGQAFREELRVARAPASPLWPVLERALVAHDPQTLENALYRWYAERGEPEPRFDAEVARDALIRLPTRAELAPASMARRILERDLERQPKREVPSRLLALAPTVEKLRAGVPIHALLPELWRWAEIQATTNDNNLAYIRKHLGNAAKRSLALAPLAELIERLARAAGTPVTVLVSELVPRIVMRLAGRKSERGNFDFDDMLTMLREALLAPGGDVLVEELRRRYRVALVDEFQDTDRVQWDIFRTIFVEAPASDPRRLVVIGDPKQAIYGFRNADVHTYHAASREIAQRGGQLVPLTVSYRSTPRLVAAINRILAEGYFTGLNAYPHPVSAGRPELAAVGPSGEHAPPIVLMHLVGRPELRADLVRSALAERIAIEIERLLKGSLQIVSAGGPRALTPADVHVLCRSRLEAEEVGAALSRARIPHAFYKQEGLFQTRAARDLAVILRALEEPRDRGRRLDAWLTPFFAVPLERIADCHDLPSEHPLVASLLSLRALADAEDWPSLLRMLVEGTGLVRRELFGSASERDLTDYLHIAEVLLEEAHRGRRSLSELSRRLSAFIEGRELPVGESGNVHRLESERRAVQLLTMHKSKGLEAEVVFLFGGLSEPIPDGLSPRVYHDEGGRRVAWLGATTPDVQDKLRRESREEAERLLYVAMTRARSRLYLPYLGPPPPDAPLGQDASYDLAPAQESAGSPRSPLRLSFRELGEPEEDDEGEVELKRLDGPYRVLNDRLRQLVAERVTSAPGELFAREVVEVRPRTRASPDARLGLIGWSPPEALLARPIATDDARFDELRRAHGGVDITSYTRMKSAVGGYRAPDELEEREVALSVDVLAEAEDALPGGAAAGVFLHEVLEEIDFALVRGAESAGALLADPTAASLFARAARRNAIAQDKLLVAARLVFDALRAPVTLADGAELAGGLAVLARRVAEMPFLHPIPERDHPRLDQAPPSPDRPAITIERGYVRGVIDLVFEHEGRYHVLDWKSDRLPSYALEPLAKHVERNYAVQAKLYSLGALRALAIHDREAYDRRFGGLVYCFVRGMREGAGVWTSRPAWDDVLAWERALRDEQAPWGYALPPRRGRGR